MLTSPTTNVPLFHECAILFKEYARRRRRATACQLITRVQARCTGESVVMEGSPRSLLKPDSPREATEESEQTVGASSKPESERHAESMEDGPLSPIKPDSPSQPTDESVKTGVNASEPVSKGFAILNAAARRAVKDVSAVSAFAGAASNSGLSKDDRIIVEKLRKVHGRCAKVAFQMADRGASWDKLFRLIDKNHDKHLDQEEFMDACRGVLDLSEQAFPDEIVQRVFRRLDEDGGGSIEVQVSNCCNTHTCH